MNRQTIWRVAVVTGAALLAAVLISAASRIPLSSDVLSGRIVEGLSDQLDADVELGGVELRLFPRLRAKASDLAIHRRDARDLPPLFSVQSLTTYADLLGLLRQHVARVELEGLAINIPPRHDGDGQDGAGSDTEPVSRTDADSGNGSGMSAGERVVIDELVANGSTLTILPKRAGKRPKVWTLHGLRLTSVGARQAMPFTSTLTNAVPPGQIETEGSFGPWDRYDPGRTPLMGRFTFDNADLGYFKGIAGTLSAKGTYGGSLDTIEVQGETDTPNFMLTIAKNPVSLTTQYHAIVDGTNGETRLEPVTATLGKSAIVAVGGVFEVPGVKGREVRLDVDMRPARIEDALRLAVKSEKPPMTGALSLQTKLVIPPGNQDVVEKLRLDGAFSIERGRFTDPGVERQLAELSTRARGKKPLDSSPPAVTSDFSAKFTLADGILQLRDLTFQVPGAVVALNGTYALRQEALNFSGNLYMDAKVSETVSGFKSVLLKVVDPLFRKNGRTVIPIKVTGTRSKPQFGLDAGRVF
jgi:hypothetical protein